MTLYDFRFIHDKYLPLDFNLDGIYADFQECPIARPEWNYSLYGPVIRDYFTLNYITRGHGTATINGIAHNIHAGQLYITFPGSTVTLYTERPDYWGYYVLYFKSSTMAKHLYAMNFSEITPVFPYENISEIIPYFTNLIEMYEEGNNNPFDKTINVCQIFSILAKYISSHDESSVFENSGNFIANALQFFEINYPHRISISDVANALGLDRSYFSRVFKKHMNISPQEYLIRLRMRRACDLLSDPDISISNVAYSVGYEPFTFSRTFKQVMGISPTDFRENQKK